MADPQVDLSATDEVHFQQHGSRCQMWIPPETKDPILLHHPTRRSVGYFGAVRLRDGKFFFHRETDKFNGATFFVFLKALYRASTTGSRRVVVITDNARHHHARLHRSWREEHAKPIRPRLSATLQPRSQPDRTGLEAYPAAMLTQPILPLTQRGHRFRRGAISHSGHEATLPCIDYAQLFKTLRLILSLLSRFFCFWHLCL